MAPQISTETAPKLFIIVKVDLTDLVVGAQSLTQPEMITARKQPPGLDVSAVIMGRVQYVVLDKVEELLGGRILLGQFVEVADHKVDYSTGTFSEHVLQALPQFFDTEMSGRPSLVGGGAGSELLGVCGQYVFLPAQLPEQRLDHILGCGIVLTLLAEEMDHQASHMI